MRHLNVRIGEYIGISPLTKRQVKPKNSCVADHLLFCNHSASCGSFNILKRENKEFLLELKKSLLIMREISHLWIGTSYQYSTCLKGPSNKYLLKLYLFLIVATFFLLNELFINLSSVSVWVPRLTIMVMLNFLFSWSWDWTLSLLRVVIRLL